MHIENKTILIVDDEFELLEIYKDLFEAENFEVLTAISGEEALNIYQNNSSIKLIISDSKMSGMSGVELLKKLKAQAKEILPMFYLATGDNTQDENLIKSFGATRLILKPFDVEEIINFIKKDLELEKN